MAKDTKEDDAETAEHKRRNNLALLSLVVGKLLGIVGVILSFSPYRMLGGVLILGAFVFVAIAIGMTIGSFRSAHQPARKEQEREIDENA